MGVNRGLYVCYKWGLLPDVECSDLDYELEGVDIMNGVDLAFDSSTNQFVVGFSQL